MSYQVAVSYGGKKLIPGPFVSLAKEFQRSADGTVRLRGWKITAKGKVSAWRGSPDHLGAFWTGSGYPPEPDPAAARPEARIANLRAKLGALAALFSVHGLWFEIQPADGTAPIKFQPRVTGFEFADGKWFDAVDFTVSMEADRVWFGALTDPDAEYGPDANPPEEAWAVEPLDDARPTYRVTHTVSAVAKARYAADGTGAVDRPGWELAREVVEARLGFDAAPLGLTQTPYNRTVSRQADQAGGKYSATEAWVLADAPYTEDRAYESGYAVETGLYTVKVTGTVTGLQTGADPADRYANAVARAAAVLDPAALHAAAQAEFGVPLNPVPASTTTARNRPAGTVTYSAEFNTRPAVPAGLLSEAVTVTVDKAVPVVAQVPVVGRPAGPVLQDTGSATQQACTVSAELVVPVAYGAALPGPPAFNPLAVFTQYCGAPAVVYVAADRETFAPRQGRYSRQTTFIFQN